jgi:hypothetical protein
MTLVLRSVVVIGLGSALCCGFAAAAGARELLILEAGGIRDSGHDVEQLVDDLLTQEGAFSGLAVQPAYDATLDYLGIHKAMVMSASAFGTSVVLSIPSTGFSRTFTGTSPNDVENQVEDFLKDDGARQLAKFYQETNARSELALLDGNPRSTTALFARGAFDRFGLGARRAGAGYDQVHVAEWGHVDLGLSAGGGAVDVDHFGSLYVADAALTLGGDLGSGAGVDLTLLGQYRDYDGASIYDAGLELGIPILLVRPGADGALRWTVTPFVQTGGGGSRNLLAGGFMVGGGGVSSLSYRFDYLELTMGNELAYYGGVPLGKIGGIRIETELDRWITRNGMKAVVYPAGVPGVSIEAGIALTHFLDGAAAVDSYASPFAGVAVELHRSVRLRVGWESDFGKNDYAAYTGRVDLGFEF